MQMAECPPPVNYPMNILEIEPMESIRKYSIIQIIVIIKIILELSKL